MSSRIGKNQSRTRMFPSRRRGQKRGVATAIGAILFFMIAFQIIAFIYEVNQVSTEMLDFDLQKARESLEISAVGFNDYSPTSLQISSGQLISGNLDSLELSDSNRLILGSEANVLTLHPSGHNLLGSTQLVSGSIANLASDDGSYMIFKSYLSATSGSVSTIAQDTFTEGADTNLENHGPDVGTSWTVNNAGSLVVLGDNELEHGADDLTTSARENTSVGDDNMNVTLSVKGLEPGDYIGPAARIPAGALDGNNMYLGRLIFDANERGDLEIVKIVGGVLTVIGTSDTNFPSEQFVKITLEITAGQQRLFACTPVPCNPTLRITTNEPDTTLQGNTFAGLRSLSTKCPTGADDYLSESTATTTYTSEVEFTGSGGLGLQYFDWFVDSSWTIGKVNVTIQLFSYANNQYVQDLSTYNGQAYLNYESSTTPNTDETKTKIITTNGGDFFDSAGNWKIKVKGEQETPVQFDFRADFVELKPVSESQTNWHGVFSITESPSSIGGLEITYTGHSDSSITQEIYIYNFTGATWDRLAQFTASGVELSVGPLPNASLASHYISGASQVLVSVNSTSSGSFNPYANYLHLRIFPVIGSRQMTVEFINNGDQDVHLVDLWIINGSQRILINSDSSPSFNANVFPGGSYSYSINFDWARGETYMVKVVSERGGIWSRITSP